jgi:amidase
MGLGRWEPRQQVPIHQQTPHLPEGDGADDVLDVDAAITERSSRSVWLRDLGGEGDYALETGLDFAGNGHVASAAMLRRRDIGGEHRVPGSAPPGSVEVRRVSWQPVIDLLERSAGELAALVRAGEVSARELAAASLQRIDELQPSLGAFTHVAHESALAAADGIGPGDSRPFAGVPIAIKDNRPVAGMPLTMCSDLFGDFTPRHDAFCVRRLREAGFVIVGKTTLPEMGILPTTESRRFGPTRNPWGLDRTPGGSSGGSGAAVSAGMVPIAHGNDGGGSTRIPAACCGLVGLKSARGRVSVGPDGGQSFLVGDGVLTRTVADSAAVLDVMAGYEPGDATWAPPPAAPFAELAARPCERLRIGLALNMPIEGAALDPVCETAARDTAALLESLGHHVEEIVPPWSGLDLLSDFTRAFGPAVSMTTLVGGRLARREPSEDDVEPLTWALWERARGQDTLSLLAAQNRLESVARSLVAFFAPFDAVLTPALAGRPLRIGEVHGRGPDPWDHYQRSGFFTPYTAIVNVTGQPAISLPLFHGEDGLPTGIQLIGPPAREDVILQLAAELEQALPWADRRPEGLLPTSSSPSGP